jgi:hypothetical protein
MYAVKYRDVQFAPVGNIANKNVSGIQVAALGNVAGSKFEGIQLGGLFNYAKHLRGLQVGLINIADTSRGFQRGPHQYCAERLS